MQFEPFDPPCYLRHAYAQTVLASLKLRALGRNPMTRSERRVVLDCRNGVRLLGYYSAVKAGRPKALAVMLHGWEGSSHSTYILRCGNHLYRHGFAVFRLNLRDHGDSHRLNRGLFYATLLDEAFEGVLQATRFCRETPAVLLGFSLGGNFAVRIAAGHSSGRHRHLSRVVAVSPVLDPEKSTARIDEHPLIRAYFLKKWRRSLRLKQGFFPETYNFEATLKLGNLRRMTDDLIRRYSSYGNAREYFRGYTLQADDLKQTTIPLTVIAADDDPIIPAEDFLALKNAGETELILHRHGGHNGFIEGIFKPAWYERYVLNCSSSI